MEGAPPPPLLLPLLVLRWTALAVVRALSGTFDLAECAIAAAGLVPILPTINPSLAPSPPTILPCFPSPAALLQAKGAQVDMEVHDDRSLLALQGPEAVQVLQQFVKADLSQVYFSNFRKLDIKGVPCFLTRTG